MTWRRFFRRSRLDAQIAGDLEFYLETETADNMARGMSAAEARAAACRKLGSPTFIREEVYHMNTAGLLDSIWQDLRYAWRVLRQAPAFTATAVLSLALGIGGNTAVFTVVRGVLLRPLPYRDPARLVKVAESDPGTVRPETVDYTTTYDLRARSRSFESLSLFRDAAAAMVENGSSEYLSGLRVNYDYFATLGVNMHLGRSFLPEEDRPDRRFQIILTHGLWTRRFGADPHILGRTLGFNELIVHGGRRPARRFSSAVPRRAQNASGILPAAGLCAHRRQRLPRLPASSTHRPAQARRVRGAGTRRTHRRHAGHRARASVGLPQGHRRCS